MSFEDWKEMMLRKAGQDPSELKSRRTHDRGEDQDGAAKASGLDSLGDDGEIDLNFDVVSEKISNIASAPQALPTEPGASDLQEPVLYDDGRTQYYRSKDAGKTCKERFSYSSFDAGATVLKTNKGAKNAKAILVENKDSYMLLECSAENKFVIVELSDDILVDTVVLANFEFFSSMIRQFRVSVSDRYPVKVDKWKDLGTFEAKNSRDIQPFLVPNPLIWAKYVRVEFLSHYGNEYYCPVSLLRVHGTRMLESWKDTETPADEEDVADESTEGIFGSVGSSDAAADLATWNRTPHSPTTKSGETIQGCDLTYSMDPLHPLNLFRSSVWDNSTCSKFTGVPVAGMTETSPLAEANIADTEPNVQGNLASGIYNGHLGENKPPVDTIIGANQPEVSPVLTAASASAAYHQINTPPDPRPAGAEDLNANSSPTKATSQTNAQSRSKNNSTIAPASPTVQESFFKAVSKRLQLLEANVTLSLKYIEDQSRSLQATQYLAERKQLSRIDSFLDSLNHTVLSELRTVRQQYDQIWQSTVIALESQREQSQRETVALSSRLNILADEVVFQKRMAIVQAILLLSCLVLVIFSRAMTQPILTGSFDAHRAPSLNQPLPGLPTDRNIDGSFTLRYDKFGRPVECSDGGHFDTGPSPIDAPIEHRQLLTPTSDIAQGSYIDDEAMPSPDQISGTDHARDEQYLRNEPDIGYQCSSSSHSTLSMGAGGFVTDEPSTAQDSPTQGTERCPAAISSLETPPSVVPDLRFPPSSRGVGSLATRKPLPALPEYPP
ncbi:sad1 unc domain protein [Colletotrichum camelliae]|nr:sad1 unc domain protein [Colletotrichum camelliae]